MSKHKYIYIYIDDTEYEFPLAIADSRKELADMIGKSEITIRTSLWKRKHEGMKSRFRKVRLY